MIKEIKYNNLTWIDIENPNQKDIDFLKENFKFHETVLDEIIPPSQRSKVENFHDYIYLVIHFPVFNRKTKLTHNRELDIIVTKTHLITNHYQPILPRKDLFDRININQEDKEKYLNKGIDFLLYNLINELLKSYYPKLDHIREDIKEIEQLIFKGKQKEMVYRISQVKRNMLSFNQALRPQKSILNSLAELSPEIFKKDSMRYFNALIGDYIKVWDVLEDLKEILDILENTNNSLFSAKLNEIMKVLTIVSVVLLPPTVLVNFFGMNIPFSYLKHPNASLIVLGMMITITLILITYFKKRDWI